MSSKEKDRATAKSPPPEDRSKTASVAEEHERGASETSAAPGSNRGTGSAQPPKPVTVKMHLGLAAGGPKEADVNPGEVVTFKAAGWVEGPLPEDEQHSGITQSGKGPEDFVQDEHGHRHSLGSGAGSKFVPAADNPIGSTGAGANPNPAESAGSKGFDPGPSPIGSKGK